MLAYVALGIAGLALWRCPFWGTGKRVFLPLYLWALYCGLAPVNIFGIQLLAYRWELAMLSGIIGVGWWATVGIRRIDALTYGWVFLIILALLSTTWSRLPEYTLARSIGLLPIFCFTILGVRCLLLRIGGLDGVATCVLIGHLVPAALALGSSFEQEVQISTDAQGLRFQGFTKATGTAHAIVTLFPFLFWHIRHSTRTHKMANLAGMGYLVYLLVATRTRASLASALLIIPIAYSTILRSHRFGGAALALLGFLAATTFGLQLLPEEELRGFARTSSTQDLMRTRLEGRWDTILAQGYERPILGHGLGMVRFYKSSNATFDFSSADESRHLFQAHTHNEYLSLFYDLGLIPPVLFIAFVVWVCVSGSRWIREPSSRKRDFMAAVLLSVSADIVNTMSHDGLLTVGNPHATFFWIKCLMLLTLQPEPRR